MKTIKETIVSKHCYTELVYDRINKKLSRNLSKLEIEDFLYKVLKDSTIDNYTKKGKNYYIINKENNIRITVNSNTYRIITVDVLKSINESN